MQFQWDGKNNDGVWRRMAPTASMSAKANKGCRQRYAAGLLQVETLSWNNGVPVLHLSMAEVGVDACVSV